MSGSDDAQIRLGRLGGVAVSVPNPAETARFLRDGIGFRIFDEGDGALRARLDGDYGEHGQEAIVLRPGTELRLDAVIWEVAEGYDLGALQARLDAAGVRWSPTSSGGVGFADPAGNPIAIERASTRAVPTPEPHPAAPRRLGHLNLKAPDSAAAARFYRELLGLRLSEQIGENLWFLRIAAEHHNLGLRPGASGMLHHLGLELSGFQLYQPILDRLDAHGWKLEYGPGRHGPGRNLFAYACDPSSGLRVELFADMAQIPDETSYVPKKWEAGDRMTKTINRWGPTPPESFLA